MARQHGLTRLFVEAPLTGGATIDLGRERAHYLSTVLRMRAGDPILLFNGRDGEWRARLTEQRRGGASATVEDRRRSLDHRLPPLWLAFALTKRPATEAIVQKATELGADLLLPLHCARSGRTQIKSARLRDIAVAAAEQCDRLDVPRLEAVMPFAEALSWLSGQVHILLADESGTGQPLAAWLHGRSAARNGDDALCLMVGPEGGFSGDELDLAGRSANLSYIDLGPRILRADTAVVAGLAVIQSLSGDWRPSAASREGANHP